MKRLTKMSNENDQALIMAVTALIKTMIEGGYYTDSQVQLLMNNAESIILQTTERFKKDAPNMCMDDFVGNLLIAGAEKLKTFKGDSIQA